MRRPCLVCCREQVATVLIERFPAGGGGVMGPMMRLTTIAGVLLGSLAATSAALAQDTAFVESSQEAYLADIYNSPGNYGVAYGTASFGKPRTWSAYSSPFGGGYGMGYGPSAILPGRHGVGIWSQGAASGGVGVPATGFYWTFRRPTHHRCRLLRGHRLVFTRPPMDHPRHYLGENG